MIQSNAGEPTIAKARAREIIAALAKPEPLPDLSSLCPDKKELTRMLLYIARGPRSPYHDELRDAAERYHTPIGDLAKKAEVLLAQLNIASTSNFYSILDVHQHASFDEIHHKWIEQMQLYHPDMYDSSMGWIAQQARLLNEAYAVLKDPEKRRDYDLQRRIRGKRVLQASAPFRSLRLGRRDASRFAAGRRAWLPIAAAIVSIALASLLVGVLLWSW
jgi:hypothetical protein